MSNQVYANHMEVSCKSAAGKSIGAFPDVCFTPPQTPATPPGVPIPYPNTGMASDTTDGSTSVQISGKEVMLKNKSYFKKSTGDEAGSAPMHGVVTHKVSGKVYFNAWSMDVKIEGENVVRNLDLTTHNHGSVPGNTPTWPYIDEASVSADLQQKCATDKAKESGACANCSTPAAACADKGCQESRKCMLVPYAPDKRAGQGGCCPGKTPHHLVEVHCFTAIGQRAAGTRLPGFEDYDDKKAPCVCCDESSRFKGDHGMLHAVQNTHERNCMDPLGAKSQMGGNDGAWNYGAAKKGALSAHSATFPGAGCDQECVGAQVDAYHADKGCSASTPIRADRSPLTDAQKTVAKKFTQSFD